MSAVALFSISRRGTLRASPAHGRALGSVVRGFFSVRRNCCGLFRMSCLREARHLAGEGDSASRPGTLGGQIRPARLAPALVMQLMKQRPVAFFFEGLVLAAWLSARADQTDVLIQAEMERRQIPGLSLA